MGVICSRNMGTIQTTVDSMSKPKGSSIASNGPIGQKELYMQFKRMRDFPIDIIPSNPQLESLQLDFNLIAEIPPQISKLTNLEEFSISRNRLTHVPAELGLLTSLRILNTSVNPIETFNSSFLTSLHNLVQLHLGSNEVTDLPNLVSNLPQLELLGLADNQLGPFFVEQQDYLFPSTLENLNLSQNNLTLCPLLTNLSATIIFLDLSDNRLTELPPSLAQMPNLKRIFLGGNNLSDLPPGIGSGWSQLVCLSMPFNSFTTLPSDLHKLTGLKTLDIRGNGLEFDAAPTSVLHMLKMVNKSVDYSQISEIEYTVTIEYEDEIPDEILPSLYLGCVLGARNKHSLKRLGITHILTVAEFKPYHPEVFSYKTVEIEDEASADILVHLEDGTRFMEEAINSGGKVLVHCRAGISRSATMVAAYVMKHQKLPRDESIDFVRERRPRIMPNTGFYNQLGKWQSMLTDNKE